MANWAILKTAISQLIKANNNQEITGPVLQNVLNNIITSVGENATFAGIAIPSTNPGVPDGPVFYLASKEGIYPNFGLTINFGESAVFKWQEDSWVKLTTGFATTALVDKHLPNSDLVSIADTRENTLISSSGALSETTQDAKVFVIDVSDYWTKEVYISTTKTTGESLFYAFYNSVDLSSSSYMPEGVALAGNSFSSVVSVPPGAVKLAVANIDNTFVDFKVVLLGVGGAPHDKVIPRISTLQADFSNLASTVEANKTEVESALEKKVNFDDKAPQLTSGFAGNLVGRGDALDSIIGFRTTAGIDSITDGAANIKRFKGNTVAWNQLAKTPHISHSGKYNSPYYRAYNATELSSVDISHKYLALYEIICTDSNNNRPDNLSVNLFVGTSLGNFNQSFVNVGRTNVFDAYFFNIEEPSYTSFGYFVRQGETQISDDISWYAYIQVHDLTLMFGSGNEPASLDDFYARIPATIGDACVPHSLLGTNVTALKTVGFNAWDEQWEVGGLSNGQPSNTNNQIRSKNYMRCLPNVEYCGTILNATDDNTLHIAWYDRAKEHITNANCTNRTVTSPKNAAYFKIQTEPGDSYGNVYKNDICVNLSHSGYRNGEYEAYKQYVRPIDISRIENIDGSQLFPYGLCRAGSVFDEITATKAIKRIGAVDLGVLTWTALQTSAIDDGRPNTRMSAKLNGIKPAEAADILGNLTCSKYVSRSSNEVFLKNKGISVERIGYTHLSLYDPEYTDPTEFKDAAQGIMLFYELETPIEVTLNEPINLDYEVSDFGTEEAIGENSAPIRADIVYQFNAVDKIRANSNIVKHKQDSLKHYTETDETVHIKVVSKSDDRQSSEIEITPTGTSVRGSSLNLGDVFRIIGAVFETLQVQSGINLAAKSLISSEIDPGELKVLHRGSPEGFIIRTVENPDNPSGRLLLEMLSTDGWDAYRYNFPPKSGEVVLKQDLVGLEPQIPLLYSDPNLDFGAAGNNVNCYGYIGTLAHLNVNGDDILIDSIGAYVREGNASPNQNVPVWCRLLKFIDNQWVIAYQSENSKAIGEVEPENLFTFKMVGKLTNSSLKPTDKIAIIYVSDENSEVGTASTQLGFKSISQSGGLQQPLTANSSGHSSWCPAMVFGYASMASGEAALKQDLEALARRVQVLETALAY